MQSTVPGAHVRVFTRCLQCLQRIGDTVTIEAHEGEVILRTINSLQSAFVSISLSKTFFDGHRVEGNSPIRCRITLKVLMNALRSFQTVESIELTVSPERLSLALTCKKDIRKVFELYVEEENEMMQAVYDANSCSYQVALNPRTMSEFVGDFNSNLDEVTLIPEQNHLRVRCCKEIGSGGDSGFAKALQTELVLDAGEFDQYSIGPEDCKLTFALRDLKALLGFCEFASKRVSVHYDTPGRPIVFKMVTDGGTLQADFVLATLVHNSAPVPPESSNVASARHATQPAVPDATISKSQGQPRVNPSVSRTQGFSQPSHASQAIRTPIPGRQEFPFSQRTAEVTPATSALDKATPPGKSFAEGAAAEDMRMDQDEESSEDEYVEPTPPPSPLASLSRRIGRAEHQEHTQ
eukprot:TRINITY_DN9024_c0_g1_i2.p1 TRINITY_DN9024_c0_g1~~TRINITY_DN9024_c0_g1_i2.p1  ORF type:complete len:408 (-),score=62.36 TRINITY_DN9024_c0_g1_i2:255-1478(-)